MCVVNLFEDNFDVFISEGFCLHAVNTKVIFDFERIDVYRKLFFIDNLTDFQKIVNLTVKIVSVFCFTTAFGIKDLCVYLRMW